MELIRFAPTPPSYELGFVVVRNRILVPASLNYPDITHTDIARGHKLLDDINKLLANDPDEVDAGFIRVANFSTKGIVAILGRSEDLGLPVSEKARKRTITVFQNLTNYQNQAYDITGA